MKFQKTLMLVVLAGLTIGNVSAQEEAKKPFRPPVNQFGKSIYPFVPVASQYIKDRIRVLAEDKTPIINFNEMIQKGLSAKNTETALTPGKKPWMSTYWP